MTYQRKPGQGSLFRNNNKKGDNSPDYTGSVNIEGKDYQISAWTKKGQRSTFLSLLVSLKDQYQVRKPRSYDTGPRPSARHDFDDEIPF